jgi:glycosyltransferase involved in cell wall biosynthesis
MARRIVIVIGSSTRAGAERVSTTLANAWSDRAREVWLVSTYLDDLAEGYPLRAAVSKVRLGDVIGRSRPSRWVAVPLKILALRKVVREIKPDVVVSFLTNVNVLAIAALARSGFPLIVSERVDPAADVELPKVVRFARLLTYPHADAFVVQTEAAAQRYRARLHGLACTRVIRNPLPRELDASPIRARQDGEGGVVIAMGRLTPQKGFAKLIEAYGIALGNNSSWSLQIWGEGPLQSDLARLIQTLNLEHCVQLRGATAHPWQVLAAAQMFALTSEYEGFPNAMLEAMALGLPCIAFDCPSGPRELAAGGSAAIIVPPRDVAKLAGVLGELAANREARRALGARAAAHVRREFGVDAVMSDWDQLIEGLLSPVH